MTFIEALAQQLNAADDDDACIADLCRQYGHELTLQVIRVAHEQCFNSQEVVPGLTLVEGFKDGTFAVTLNDYGPGADDVSTILSFDTKEEALAFIAENRGPMN